MSLSHDAWRDVPVCVFRLLDCFFFSFSWAPRSESRYSRDLESGLGDWMAKSGIVSHSIGEVSHSMGRLSHSMGQLSHSRGGIEP